MESQEDIEYFENSSKKVVYLNQKLDILSTPTVVYVLIYSCMGLFITYTLHPPQRWRWVVVVTIKIYKICPGA